MFILGIVVTFAVAVFFPEKFVSAVEFVRSLWGKVFPAGE